MPVGIYTRKPLSERFWSKVDKRGPNGCWSWMGGTNTKGYGKFNELGAMVMAHRFVYEITYGKFDHSLWVLHHCDNPNCVNPLHLFLGTYKDNLIDMYEKGRQPRGEKHGSAKLTSAQVRFIRQLVKIDGIKHVQLARIIGVSGTEVNEICAYKVWAHIK